jgi:hypothetical protein
MLAHFFLSASQAARADPPIPAMPEWREDDRNEADPDPSRGDDLDTDNATASPTTGGIDTICNLREPERVFDWFDSTGAIALLPALGTGQVGRWSWLRVTARVDGVVTRWYQGPFLDDAIRTTAPIVMDPTVVAAVSDATHLGELSVAVEVVQGDGTALTTAVLPRLVFWEDVLGSLQFSLRDEIVPTTNADGTVSADL